MFGLRELVAQPHTRVLDATPYADDLQAGVDELTRRIADTVNDERDAVGAVLYLPAGRTYWVREPPLRLLSQKGQRRDRVAILGGGPTSVIRVPDKVAPGEDGDVAVLEVRATAGSFRNPDPRGGGTIGFTRTSDWTVRDVRIDGRTADGLAARPGLVGLRLHGSTHARVRNVEVLGCGRAGVALQLLSGENVLEGLGVSECGIGVDMRRSLPWSEYCKDTVLWVRNGAYEDAQRMCPPCGHPPTGPDLPRERECEDGSCVPEGANGECVPGLSRRYDNYLRRHVLALKARPPADPADWDYVSHNGISATFTSTLRGCHIERCREAGVRIFGGTSHKLFDCVVAECEGNGITARDAIALRIDNCHLRGNGATVEPLESDEDLRGAQIVLGDGTPHGSDPADEIDWGHWLASARQCRGVNMVGCHFDAQSERREDSTPTGRPLRSSVGVRDHWGWGTSVFGCTFRGGHQVAPVWLDHGSERAVVIPAWVDGGERDYRVDMSAHPSCITWPRP